MAADDDRYLTTDQVKAKLTGLKDADLNRLRELARRFVVESPFRDENDLLMDAIEKILSGDRQWPKDLEVSRFFLGVFRSLRSSHEKSRSRRSKHRDIRSESETLQKGNPGDRTPIENTAGNPSSPEQNALAKDMLQSYQQAFENDELAWDVLEWRAAGFSRDEIKLEFGLTDTEFETITKRIRRKASQVQKAEERYQ